MDNYNLKAHQEKNIEESLFLLIDYRDYITDFPRSFFGEKKLSASAAASFLNADENEQSALGRGKAMIVEMEEALQNPKFKDNAYSHLDYFFQGFDKEEGLTEVSRIANDLGHIKTLLIKNNSNLDEVLEYAQKLQSKMGAANNEKLSSIAVSDFHLQNVNEIFFTKNIHLDPKLATSEDFIERFTAGDQIKAIVYLDDIFANIYGSSEIPEYVLKTSSNDNQFEVEGFITDHATRSFIEFYIVIDAANYSPSPGQACEASISMDFLGDLPPRTHTVEVMLLKGKQPAGSFKFNADNDAGVEKMASEKKKIRDKYLERVKLPAAKMTNATYQSELIELFNRMG